MANVISAEDRPSTNVRARLEFDRNESTDIVTCKYFKTGTDNQALALWWPLVIYNTKGQKTEDEKAAEVVQAVSVAAENPIEAVQQSKHSWFLYHLKDYLITEYLLTEKLMPLYKSLHGSAEEGINTEERENMMKNCVPPAGVPGSKVSPSEASSVQLGTQLWVQFGAFLRRKQQEGTVVDYFDAVSGMACKHAVVQFTTNYGHVRFFSDVANQHGISTVKMDPWINDLLQQQKFSDIVAALADQKRLFLSNLRLLSIVWHLKAVASKALAGQRDRNVPERKGAYFGYSRLCSLKCKEEILGFLAEPTGKTASGTRALQTDLVAVFLFQHYKLVQATEAAMDKILSVVLVYLYAVCRVEGGRVICNDTEADTLWNDPTVMAPSPSPFQQLAMPTDSSNQGCTQFGEKIPRSPMEWRKLYNPKCTGSAPMETLAFAKKMVALVNAVSKSISTGSTINAFRVARSLWIRARELHIAFTGATQLKQVDRVFQFLTPLFFWLTVTKAAQGLKDQYSPLTSAALQVVGYLHTSVEMYKPSLARRIGSALLRWSRWKLPALSWQAIERAVSPTVRLNIPAYKKATKALADFAEKFRSLFIGVLPVSLSVSLLILTGLWVQGDHRSLHLADKTVSKAASTLWFMTFLHPEGATGVAVDAVMDVAKQYRAVGYTVEFGRIVAVGDGEHNLHQLLSPTKYGLLRLKRADVQNFFSVLSAATADPVAIIQMGIDLANTLDSLLKMNPGKSSSKDDLYAIMQSEAVLHYHCAFLKERVAVALSNKLKEEKNPERFQAALTEFLDSVQIATAAVQGAGGVTKEEVRFVCPFMKYYPEETKVAEERKQISVYVLCKLMRMEKPIFTHQLNIWASRK